MQEYPAYAERQDQLGRDAALSANETWRRHDDWVGSQVEDQYVIINLESGEYIAMNSTTSVVWNLLAEAHTAEQLAKALVAQFAVADDRCAESVDRLLADMADKRMIFPVV